MTSYERVLTTLHGQEPDRVPIFELLIDPTVINAILPGADYPDFVEAMGIDVVVTNTPSKLYEEKVLDAEQRIVVNEWGIVRQYGAQIVSMPLEGPIKNIEDLDTYKPPDPYTDRRYNELRRLLSRFKGRKVVGMHLHDGFNYPCYLRGMQQLMMDLFENPDFVHKLVRLSIDHNTAIAERAIEFGADFIILGDDYGSVEAPLISPKHFREFFLPAIREIVEAVHAKGAFCFKHCCGNINLILEDMVRTGIDALHPFDATAGMDLVAVKQRFPRLTVMGGVDCGPLLSDRPVQDVINEVKRLLRVASPGGRYIISSTNTIHNTVRPENYLAMLSTVKEVGRSPVTA
jgi:uroporphyrinogen decarboxylase